MSESFFATDEDLLKEVLAWSYRRIVDRGDPTAGARSASELEAALSGSVSGSGIGGTEALRLFDEVIVPATRAQGHPMNLAYVPAAPTAASLGFDLAVSAAEIFGGIWEAGSGAIHAENQALSWLAGLAGWPDDAGGTFVPGATIGNLSALHAARDSAEADRGRPEGRWSFAATAAAHSSVATAAAVLGVDVVAVPVDDGDRMRAESLEAALSDVTVPTFAVVATVGTTNAGAIDDLAGIADVCARRGLWLHVDGAYGLAALAGPSMRHRLAGIERADSFVVDPHKWLFAPYDSCALLYREPLRAARAHSQHASYLDGVDRAEWNPTDYAIQLTRRVRGLPFWFSLATYGTERYGAAIEKVLETTREVASGIRAAPHLELLLEPELSVILFNRPGWSDTEMWEWSERNRRAGTVLCIPTAWRGSPAFRICMVNPDTSGAHVLDLLDTMQ